MITFWTVNNCVSINLNLWLQITDTSTFHFKSLLHQRMRTIYAPQAWIVLVCVFVCVFVLMYTQFTASECSHAFYDIIENDANACDAHHTTGNSVHAFAWNLSILYRSKAIYFYYYGFHKVSLIWCIHRQIIWTIFFVVVVVVAH